MDVAEHVRHRWARTFEVAVRTGDREHVDGQIRRSGRSKLWTLARARPAKCAADGSHIAAQRHEYDARALRPTMTELLM